MPPGDRNERNPRTYTLAFPRDLEMDRVAAWLRSVSGTLRSSSLHPGGSPVIGFEVWSDSAGLTYRLKVQPRHAEYVVAELRSLVAGIRVMPEDDQPSPAWTRVVEIGIRGSQRPLRIFSETDTATAILASLQGTRRREVLLVQWVMTPAIPVRPPAQERHERQTRFGSWLPGEVMSREEIRERRTKLEDANMLAVLRVAAVADTETRADELLSHVRAALASTRSPAVHFVRRFATNRALHARIAASAGSFAYPVQLSVPEASALIAWPIGSPHVAGLPQTRSRHLPPSGSIAREGLVVARANFPSAERPLAITFLDACKHLHLVGPIGVGKTALAGNLAVQAMASDAGVIVMERKGDLFRLALDAVPRRRREDVIVVDVSDSHPVGYNLLGEGGLARVTVEEICQLFEYLYPDMRRGIWARAALHRGLSTLITRPGMTFIDLVPLLSPNHRTDTERQWRDELIAGVDDPELTRFWDRFDGLSPQQQENYAAPVLDRVWQLNERPEIRNIIGQSVSSFSMRDVIRERKVLLINLSGLGIETARLAGTLLLNSLWSAVRGGAADPARPTHLFLDEFQDFLTLPIDPESLLVQARSFGLAMVLAHQHLDQLPASVRSAVLANARSKVVFQTTADDARVFTREFGKALSEDDFMNLGQYEVLCRLATTEGVSPPVSGVTLPPPEATGMAGAVVASSRERYGRAPAEIAADIAQRRSPRSPEARRRPRLGGTAWDG